MAEKHFAATARGSWDQKRDSDFIDSGISSEPCWSPLSYFCLSHRHNLFPDLPFPYSDKVNHLLAYAAMMFWFGQIFRKCSASLLIASGLVAMGIVLEYIQGSTGYRTFEYADMAANGIGAVAGLFLSWTRLGGLLLVFEGLLTGRMDPPPSKPGPEHADSE